MKKNFKDDNPALAFIGAGAQPVRGTPEGADAAAPDDDHIGKEINGYTDADVYMHAYTRTQKTRETKSRRLQILLRPSLYQAIARLAEESGLSVNETIRAALEAYLLLDANNKNRI